jgi:hypothetical protein
MWFAFEDCETGYLLLQTDTTAEGCIGVGTPERSFAQFSVASILYGQITLPVPAVATQT